MREGTRLLGYEDQLTEEDLFQTNELSRPASSRLVHKAQQQADKGELAAAIRTLQRAVDLDPHPAALELLGGLWVKFNQPERAIIPLAAAVTLDPRGGAAAALAHVFMRLRREREAHAMATIALERRPGDRSALEVLEATRDDE
jgi:tetratricopeptide (TPR) repeat protein